jgi:hypothetical protein
VPTVVVGYRSEDGVLTVRRQPSISAAPSPPPPFLPPFLAGAAAAPSLLP